MKQHEVSALVKDFFAVKINLIAFLRPRLFYVKIRICSQVRPPLIRLRASPAHSGYAIPVSQSQCNQNIKRIGGLLHRSDSDLSGFYLKT